MITFVLFELIDQILKVEFWKEGLDSFHYYLILVRKLRGELIHQTLRKRVFDY